MTIQDDIYIYNEENLVRQLESSAYELGFYRVKFYTNNGLPSETPTDQIDDFFLYPSGGTLRDKNFNIIFYSTKFDTYRGYVPPHLKNRK